ncbi:MAG: branched-chain amino acid transport system permease protein [Thermoleophilaceae bacterium]|nr:branched-chain amino acid transport system permease protein [Thermoleophilaceae bacterium]
MTHFIELLISGISLGFVYALIALGFVMIFKATRVINFAHGSLLLLGAYLIARLHGSLGFGFAVLVGVAATALVGALVQILILRRLRGAPSDTLTIVTIGIDILLATELTRRIGTKVLSEGDPWRDQVTNVGSISIPEARVAAAIAAIVILAGFLAAFRFSGWGIALRSAAEDGEAAALMGIRLGRVATGAWALAGALAAVGGLFFTTFPTPGVDANVGLSALSAFPAAILGGLDSVVGAVVGGLVIGVVVTLTAGYQDQLSFLGRGLSDAAPYVVMLLVLLVRPSGLFGTKELTRV